jgi:CBS domain-containing protein
MTEDPVTISQDATVGEAAQTMLIHKIGGLPVIDQDQNLVGIITESDIFRLVVRDWNRSGDDSAEPYSHYGS